MLVPFVLDLCYAAALAVLWPALLYRRWRRGSGGAPLGELLGRVPSRPVSAHCIWIHGVSLGEVNATRSLVAELRRRAPGAVVVLSSSTRTGREQIQKVYATHVSFRYPLDFSFIVRRVLERIRPSIIVLMELEVWPNLVALATSRGIPVVIANGRVTSERSMRRFGWPVVRTLAQRMFGQLTWVGAQAATYQQRFIELGVRPDRVEITGSVKYDTADVRDQIEGQAELAAEMGIVRDRPLWVCGSTGPGEEELILTAYERVLENAPALQLALVPRHPERFDAVAQLIVQRGFACLRRSSGAPQVPDGAVEPRPVFLGDSMGELRKFYALAAVTFVGRSLVPLGGSDVMEAAGLAKPVLVGPHTDNFAEAVEVLLAEGGARRVTSAEALGAAVLDLVRHPERAAAMGTAGRAAIVSRRGATARTVEQILVLI